MSQENPQSPNSQNDSGQQTLEEIKTRSEIIIKEKCKDDFKLNNLRKDHQDFQKLIEDKNQQISDAEKDSHYLTNAFEQLEITRGSVETDVDMIVKSVAEYFELFNELKASMQNIKSDFDKNENVIKEFSENIQNHSGNLKFQEKLQELEHKRKLLQGLRESNSKLKKEKNIFLENKRMVLINLDKEEQDLLMGFKVLQSKNDEIMKDFYKKNKLKDDLQDDLKIIQEQYDVAFQQFETEKLNTDKKIEEFESLYNSQREKITELEKNLEGLGAERKTQISLIEEAKVETNSLQEYLTGLENMIKNQEDEQFKYKKLIDELRSESYKIIEENENLLKNLDEELCKINTSNDQIEQNLISDTKILEDLKHEEDFKKDEINSLENKIQDITKAIQENEIKHEEIINGYNTEIDNIKTQKQILLDKKAKLIAEKDNISQMISDLQLKKTKCRNESAQIEAKQNAIIKNINDEITNLRNILAILKEDSENMKSNYDIQYEKMTLKFKEKKNEILVSTNQYKERRDIMDRKAEEAFKMEKNQLIEDQSKMALQISEFNAAIDNLQEELKKIVKQINSEHDTKIVKLESTTIKAQNILKQNGPTEPPKLLEVQNKKEEIVPADKVFEWTTDEEEYKFEKSQKMKNQSQTSKKEKAVSKLQMTPKKLGMSQKKKKSPKRKISKMLIEKVCTLFNFI